VLKELKFRIEAAARLVTQQNVALTETEKKNLQEMVKKFEELQTPSEKNVDKKGKHSPEGYFSKFIENTYKQPNIDSILQKVEKQVQGSKVLYLCAARVRVGQCLSIIMY